MTNKISQKYNLMGMDCPGCAHTIERYCMKIKGMEKVEVNYSARTIKLEYENENVFLKVEDGLKKLGFTLQQPKKTSDIKLLGVRKIDITRNQFFKIHKIYVYDQKNVEIQSTSSSPIVESKRHDHRNEIIQISTLLCLFIAASGLKLFYPFLGNLIFDIIVIISVYPLLKKIFEYFKVGFYFSVEFLMGIAIVSALFIHAAQEATMVLILYKTGELLEGYTASKAMRGVQKLSSLIPEEAHLVLKNNSLKNVKASEILKNDILLVKPSERFPADGILLEGNTSVDESLLTGESIPVSKKENDMIHAGAMNLSSPVKVKATQVGENHSVGKLIRLVEEAQGTRSKTFRMIEKFTRYYTPVILFLGIGSTVFLGLFTHTSWNDSIYSGLAMLLIGCPCALIVSTPSAISAGISSASKLGILIKNAMAIEEVGQVKSIAFDKTGTLTEGKLQVSEIFSFSDEYSKEEIVHNLASLEQYSTHPIAKVINEYAASYKKDVISQVEVIPGVGFSALLNQKKCYVTSLQYAIENKFFSVNQKENVDLLKQNGKIITILSYLSHEKIIAIGAMTFQDRIRDDAEQTIQSLKKLGIYSLILSGDNKKNAQIVADKLHMSVRSELLPENKLQYIQELSKNGKIAMVGDGMNDAPALAVADIGIAIGNMTDIAADTAQIIITNHKVFSVVHLIEISRKTLNIMKQNIFVAIFLKAVFLYLTFIGHTWLWMAILADTGATVLVTLNSLRLLGFQPKIKLVIP